MGQPRCSSWYSTQDCSNSQQNHRHANHCCSCRRQSHREHRPRPKAPTISPIKLFQMIYFPVAFQVLPGSAPDPPAAMRQAVHKKGQPQRTSRHSKQDRPNPQQNHRQANHRRRSRRQSHNPPGWHYTNRHHRCTLFRILSIQQATCHFPSFWFG